MLYDKKWEKKVETKTDPFSLDALIAWLETKEPSQIYPWADCDNCLVAQYLRERLGSKNPPGDYIFHEVFAPHYDRVAGEYPHNFGAALDRARKLQAS